MLPLAIICAIIALFWTIVVLYANGMSDAPGAEPKGGGTVVIAWMVVAILLFCWAMS